MNDKLKKLTGKNPDDFEPVAYSLINKPDIELFKELVDKDDFLFDFVKQNVASRLEKKCNQSNYLNLLNLMKFYSPSYEGFIISVLVKYANEDLTDRMLALFEDGNDDEKTYCAKYFSFIQDPLSIDFLKENSYSDSPYLSSNCAATLASMHEETSYKDALQKLYSEDDFEVLDGVKFLVSYGNKASINKIIEVMKHSPFAENIACELPYLCNMQDLLKNNETDGLFVLNLIINGLGEISSPSQVFDFQLYEIFENLLHSKKSSKIAVVLLNAFEKFNTLTENNEYLYDETKDVKQEITDIKNLLSSVQDYKDLIDDELNEDSLFIYSALDLSSNMEKVRKLLNSSNQTIVLKAIEILKQNNLLHDADKNIALSVVTDENIRNVINAI